MEIGKFKLAKANLIRPPKKPTSEFLTQEEAEAKSPGLFNAEINENVVTKNYEAEDYINRIKSYVQSKYIDEDFARRLINKKLKDMDMTQSDLDTSAINFATGGQVTERQNYSKGTPIKKALNTLIESGETSYEDLFALKDKIQEITGSRPGGSFQLNNKTYGDLLSQFDFESFATRSKAASPESYLLTDKQAANIVNKINKEFGLVDDNGLPKKGIKVNVIKTKQGKNAIQLYPNSKIYKGAKRMQGGFEKSKINELKDEIRKLQKTDAYKNYDKGIIYKNIGKESAITQLRNDGSKQDLIFDYLLKEKKPVTINQLAKTFKMSSEAMERDLGLLYKNIMRKASDKGGAFLPDDINKLSSVRDTLKQIPDVDFRKDTVLNLIYDAYKGDPEKLTPMLNKVENFYSLQKKIPEEFRDVFGAQLDHIIPMNFLKQVDEGKDPLNLIRIQPLPTLLNNKSFKGNFDTRLGQAIRSGDQEVVKAFSELQKYLPTEFGGISPEGKIINFGAEPLTLERSLTQQQQKFGDVYKRVLNFIDNPKVQPLLEKAGINPETAFNVLRTGAAAYKKNLPAFLSTFRKILKDNPSLRVELGDEFADIENQYASASLMSDVSPVQQKTDTGIPYEAALPAGVLFGKYVPQILKGAKEIVKPVISPAGAALYSSSEMFNINPFSEEFGKYKEDGSLSAAGAQLFYPEIIGQIGSKAKYAQNVYNQLLNLGLPVKYLPQVSKGMSGIGSILIGGDIAQGLAKRIGPDQRGPLTEEELLSMREKETTMAGIADTVELASKLAADQGISYKDALSQIQNQTQKYAVGGRVNFADGPEDPSKRKFMKIMGGLASLPIVGRFFDIAQVAPVAYDAAKDVGKIIKNAPPHFLGLVNKIRALGKIVDPKKLLYSERDRYKTVYDYGDYRMFERPDGQIEISKQKLMPTEYGDGIVSEEYMSYDPKRPKFNKKGEKIEGEYDEVYEENTTYADQYGEMADVREGVEPETINDGTFSKEELEQLIIEQIEDSIKKGKK